MGHESLHCHYDLLSATVRVSHEVVFRSYNFPSASNVMKGTVIRASISDQVVLLLRQGLVSGRWKGELPSEVELCRDFDVSRATLRKAIEQLVGEKWLRLGGRGKHHRILRSMPASLPGRGNIIRILTPYAPSLLD